MPLTPLLFVHGFLLCREFVGRLLFLGGALIEFLLFFRRRRGRKKPVAKGKKTAKAKGQGHARLDLEGMRKLALNPHSPDEAAILSTTDTILV